jgi:hypothetical protein
LAQFKRSGAVQIATLWVGLRLGLGRQQTALNARRIGLRSAHREPATIHRVHRLAVVSAGLRKAHRKRLPTAVPVRSPPYEARASSRPRSRATQEVTFRVEQVLRRHSPLHGVGADFNRPWTFDVLGTMEITIETKNAGPPCCRRPSMRLLENRSAPVAEAQRGRQNKCASFNATQAGFLGSEGCQPGPAALRWPGQSSTCGLLPEPAGVSRKAQRP